MNEVEREVLFNRLRSWVLQAGAIIRKKIDEPLNVTMKSNRKDLVTEIDKEIEKFFVTRIRNFYPSHYLLTEEGFGDPVNTLEGIIWIIDPIDGTMNFVHQRQNFAISIGIYDRGIGEIGIIYDVMQNNLYCALRGCGAFKNDKKLSPLTENKRIEDAIICLNHRWLCENSFVDELIMQKLVKDVRGTRTYGAAAIEFALIAEGALDAYISMRLQPWDIAAGKIIVNEVGGLLTKMDGEPVSLLKRAPIVCCNASLHQSLIENYLKKAKK